MAPEILNGWIIGSCTFAGSLVTVLIVKWNDMFSFNNSEPKLQLGLYDSYWYYNNDKTVCTHESLFIEKQKGNKIFGYITMEKHPKKRWDVEGIFNGRYLQMFYFPSKKAEEDFLGYGCYFLEKNVDGSFTGYTIGIDPDKKITDSAMHEIKYLRKNI